MPRETMTPRERWEAVLSRQKPDRVPMDIWLTEEARQKLCRHLACTFDEALEKLHIDTPRCVGGRYVGPPLEKGTDVFGVKFRVADYGSGSYEEFEYSPLAEYTSVDEIEANYTWPDPDWWDYSHLPEAVKGNEHRPVRGGGSEPMNRYMKLRGDEQAYMDLLMYPEIVEYCMGKLFDLCYEDTRRIFETIPGVVNITYVAEDLGGQDSLLYSKEQIHQFMLPGMRRMAQLTREHGSHVFTHSDGAVFDIIPDLIDMGMEVLNPIQWRCPGMERERLRDAFGQRISFHGGVDNQQTLPFGTVDEVRREVIENLEILGAYNGYILAPCHNIQAVSPPENVVALYETGYSEGWR